MLMQPFTPDLPLELDPAHSWPAQGAWTYDDYLRLPDDGQRFEILFGVLYMQAAPNYDHQYIVAELNFALKSYVRERQLGIVLTAPFEVHLKQIARPVQPDLLFIPTDRLPAAGARALEVAPALVVEVLSPGTRRRDLSVKLDVYEQGGVLEYWIADPVARTVTVYSRPNGEQAFELLGVFTADQTLQSALLPELALPVGGLFVGGTGF